LDDDSYPKVILSNGIAILDRFFSFRFTSALIAFYNCIFGIFIVSIEAPGVLSVDLAAKVRYYAKFLEYTWGRGILYIFCGSLQVTNVNMLDWCVGGWMILVGITAIIVGMSTQKQLRLLKLSIKSEEDLKQKWNQYDTSGSGSLDVKELTAFVRGEGIEMSSNEVAATFMALDKNFDDRITFEEFQAWWMNTDATNGRAISV
jgi:EF-hand domain pair/COPI associated protein